MPVAKSPINNGFEAACMGIAASRPKPINYPHSYKPSGLATGNPMPEMSLQEAIGTTLKNLRHKRGLKQIQVANLVRSHRQYIYKLEAGQHVCTTDRLYAIVTAMDCSMHIFFKNVEQLMRGNAMNNPTPVNGPVHPVSTTSPQQALNNQTTNQSIPAPSK